MEVSKYYLDHHPLSHTPQAQLPTQQLFKPPPTIESIQIGDSIDVLVGKHMGKSGVVRWLSKGGNYLWFQHESLNIPVPIKTVQRIPNLQTLQYTQDRGYDVKAGDVVKVAHGPEYSTKGVVQSVDFPNTSLTLLAETDHSLVSPNSSQTCACLTFDRLTFLSDLLSKYMTPTWILSRRT